MKRGGSAQKIKRYKTIKEQHQINENIKDREVRLIDENGEQMGIVSGREALEIAEERELDLVKISPNANPPVCKIMNYGKYVFELAKKEKEAKGGALRPAPPTGGDGQLTACGNPHADA